MDSTPRNEAPMRERDEDMAKLKESLEIIGISLQIQFSLISFFKGDKVGEEFLASHPIVVMAMVLLTQLLFFVWLLVTMLCGRVSGKILRWMILVVLGGVSSVLVLPLI
ncbi:hypothetical protein PIB30_014438 [Stylosanthes scabra]|uniref:Uncharacterized protein n=1 Tax=Stylosanthes scabra TaxID=79078 RepID=A0ABU6V542_9FABA|nr:hypothetical protein [Stylosanthes scabra]